VENGGVFVEKKWKMGVFFVKKVENGVFCKKVNLSPTQGALCTVSVFLFYILLIWGVRTHPTNLPAYGPGFLGRGQPAPSQLVRESGRAL